jgi:hypothetical protein
VRRGGNAATVLKMWKNKEDCRHLLEIKKKQI